MRKMVRTQAAICRASAFLYWNIWCVSALSVLPISAELFVHFIRTKIQFFCFAVSLTYFAHEDLAVSFEDVSRENLQTVRTYTLCLPDEILILASFNRPLDMNDLRHNYHCWWFGRPDVN